jgi:hypothetical protein
MEWRDSEMGRWKYVGLQDDGSAAARRFHERVRDPLLTDLTIDWGGLAATDVHPAHIPDLLGASPVRPCSAPTLPRPRACNGYSYSCRKGNGAIIALSGRASGKSVNAPIPK